MTASLSGGLALAVMVSTDTAPTSAASVAANSADAAAVRGKDPLPNRPDFRLPFPCGVKVLAQTYPGHDKDGKKIDMLRYGMEWNSPITASASGTVHQHFSPGGIEIRHGKGWFTTYMHMKKRVKVGSKVKRGDIVGYMSDVGSKGRPHLHYEQLYAPGKNDADNQHMVRAIIQGRGPLDMYKETPIKNWKSTNCKSPAPKKYYVVTKAKTSGYTSPKSNKRVGYLNKGKNYVFCTAPGISKTLPKPKTTSKWWLKTDLDSGQTGRWVPAAYLGKGSGQPKDIKGKTIPRCK
ncbi:M23 family metallopeptidase [Actinomadura sp. 6N118]|uniref:M23 family metallopeptidase n=1 Tax=Actinomadura sp. 6N118 TaxID=3375151 RepID=UPI0037ADA6E8